MLLSGFNGKATVEPRRYSYLEFPGEGALGQRYRHGFAAGSHVLDHVSHKINETTQRPLRIGREPRQRRELRDGRDVLAVFGGP